MFPFTSAAEITAAFAVPATEVTSLNVDLSMPNGSRCEGSKINGKIRDLIVVPVPNYSAKEIRDEGNITSVLLEWLEKEVKGHLQSIDDKLDELVTRVRYSGTPMSKIASNASRPKHVPKGPHRCFSNGSFQAIPHSPKIQHSKPHMYVSEGAGASENSSEETPVVTVGHCQSSKTFETISHLLPFYSSADEKLARIHELILRYQNSRGKKAAIVWRLLENPHSSPLAKLYTLFFSCTVLFSVFAWVWQTDMNCPLRESGGELMQTCFEVVFALEFALRLFVCPDRWNFMKDALNYIDLFSALPLVYRMTVGISVLLGSSYSAQDFLFKFPLVPIVRLLKLTRRFEKFRLLFSAYLIALEALPVLIYTMLFIAVFFATLIFLVEPEDNIGSVPVAIWFIMVTMTTVGYGDISPVSTSGHVIITVLMICSGLYMAIPIGIVGTAFSTVWVNRDKLLLMHRLREAFLVNGFSEKAILDIVTLFDEDGDGELDIDEFKFMLSAMSINISTERAVQLLDCLDTDGSGSINVDEFMNGLFQGAYSELFTAPARLTKRPTVRSEAPTERTNLSNWDASGSKSKPSVM